MSKLEQLDPKRPWKSKFWKMANFQHKLWVLMMSSDLFWLLMVASLVISFVFAVQVLNMCFSHTELRRILEPLLGIGIFVFSLPILVGIFELSFRFRDFISDRVLKKK